MHRTADGVLTEDVPYTVRQMPDPIQKTAPEAFNQPRVMAGLVALLKFNVDGKTSAQFRRLDAAYKRGWAALATKPGEAKQIQTLQTEQTRQAVVEGGPLPLVSDAAQLTAHSQASAHGILQALTEVTQEAHRLAQGPLDQFAAVVEKW